MEHGIVQAAVQYGPSYFHPTQYSVYYAWLGLIDWWIDYIRRDEPVSQTATRWQDKIEPFFYRHYSPDTNTVGAEPHGHSLIE